MIVTRTLPDGRQLAFPTVASALAHAGDGDVVEVPRGCPPPEQQEATLAALARRNGGYRAMTNLRDQLCAGVSVDRAIDWVWRHMEEITR